MGIKILAFLQNCWFPVDTKADYINKYLTDDVFRRRVLARGWSGKRLLNSFGEDMFSKIIWENASIEVGQESSYCGEPDLHHVECCIKRHKPNLILTFGVLAKSTVELLNTGIPLMSTKHPNARGFKKHMLDHFAKNVHQYITTAEEKKCSHT